MTDEQFKPLTDEELRAVREAYEDGCDIDLSLVFDELIRLRKATLPKNPVYETFVRGADGSVQFSDDESLHDEVCRLREENRRMAFQLEKTAKRFDAMKFKDFASECRAAIEGSK